MLYEAIITKEQLDELSQEELDYTMNFFLGKSLIAYNQLRILNSFEYNNNLFDDVIDEFNVIFGTRAFIKDQVPGELGTLEDIVKDYKAYFKMQQL